MQTEAYTRERADAVLNAAEKRTQAATAVSRKATIIAVIFLIVLIALMILIVWLLTRDPARTANIRDIVIVLAAGVMMLTNLAIGAVLIVLVYRLQDLIHILRNEIQPTLANVSQTVRSVTGTARLVSDSVAKPTIRAASFVAGLQQVARVTRRKVNERREK
jgi:hypothetical protein